MTFSSTEATPPRFTKTTNTKTKPESDEDFEQFLTHGVNKEDLPLKEFAEKLGRDWDVLKDHEKAGAVLMWGYDQTRFRKQLIDPRLLYQVVFGVKKKPKLNKISPTSKNFADTKFDTFYNHLVRYSPKMLMDGGLLVKKRETEEVVVKSPKGPMTYFVGYFVFCFSRNQNDRMTEGVAPSKKNAERAVKRFAAVHATIKKGSLTEENRTSYDRNEALIEGLTTPKLQGLFRPAQLPATTKNGTFTDPPRKP
jgi:hypothetical protein